MTFLYRFKAFHAALIAAVCLIMAAPRTSRAAALKKITLDEAAKAADVIVVGQVQNKEARWADRRIETTVKIAAEEYWKGDLGDSFDLTHLGGELTEPLPIAMDAGASPKFYAGERVALFLRKPPKRSGGKKAATQSRIPGSYRVVGGVQGKYTIITDPETGEERVVRLGLSGLTAVDKREMAARMRFAEKLASKKAELKKSRGDVKNKEEEKKESASKAVKAARKKAAESGEKATRRSLEDPFGFSKEDVKSLGFDKAPTLEDLKSKISDTLN